MSIRRRALGGVAAVLVALGPVPRAAGEPTRDTVHEPSIVALPSEFAGGLEGHWRQEFESRLETRLEHPGLRLATTDETTTLDKKSRCQSADCHRQLAAALHADYLVRVAVRVRDRDFTLSLELVDGTTGHAIAQRSRVCELCGVEEAVQAIGAQFGVVMQQLEVITRRPRLLVRSTPSGAAVEIDGEVVGETPFATDLDPGKHRLHIRKSGFLVEQRELEVVRGVGNDIDIALTHRPTSWQRRAGPAGWVSLSSGLGLLASGATLLAIDERPYRRRCETDLQGICRYRYDTLTGGAILTGVGMVAIITGVSLVISARARRGSAGHRARRVTMTTDGLALRW